MENCKIGSRVIGLDTPPFVIAEMSGNHNQSLERAIKLVEAAAASGVDALKLQTYTAETMTLDISHGDFFINDPKSLWNGKSLYQLYQEAYTPWEWHEPIFNRCRELGILCFSTPFDISAINFLEKLNVPCYKIASFENTDLPLISAAAKTGKPLIISTGMASIGELGDLVETTNRAGSVKPILLKCTSTYPASPENSNLLTIPHMRDLFGVEVGLSDHTLGIGVSVASVALGATVIEKHFTLSRSDGGVDSVFSMEPAEMKQLVIETKQAWQAKGTIKYGPNDLEASSIAHRRSIYVVQDLKSGSVLSDKNIKIIRPGKGLPPKFFGDLLGKRINRDLPIGTPMSWDFIG